MSEEKELYIIKNESADKYFLGFSKEHTNQPMWSVVSIKAMKFIESDAL